MVMMATVSLGTEKGLAGSHSTGRRESEVPCALDIVDQPACLKVLKAACEGQGRNGTGGCPDKVGIEVPVGQVQESVRDVDVSLANVRNGTLLGMVMAVVGALDGRFGKARSSSLDLHIFKLRQDDRLFLNFR